MKVGILTMFNGLATVYSLVNVVADHIKMLLDEGIEVRLLVSEDLDLKERRGIFLDPRIEWVKVCNRFRGEQITWRDYSSPKVPIHDTFMEEAETIGKDLVTKLEGLEVCMLHDILFQGWHLVHNVAVRYAAERLPELKFIAMTHSLPDESQVGQQVEWPHSARYSAMPNTIYVYPTKCGLKALSRQYRVPVERCHVLNNTLNLLENVCEEVLDLNRQVDLTSPDILIVYPARFTTGKRFEKVAMLAGAIKSVSTYQVKVVFCEFPSMDISESEYKGIIRQKGIESGLELEDMVFTSDCGYPDGMPRAAILDLFTLSNLFICPSFSESFGLTVLEAASRGNYLVLNEAVPALEELGKNLEAYFMRWDARNFGFATQESYFPSEGAYYEEHGKKILIEMEHNHVVNAKMKVRKRYSTAWVFENQLKQLLEQPDRHKDSRV
ncbi:MAG TPA: glycosyltransferase [Clostridiales bacterium]|nr:glycosyltransferase [Clostridiales bacterium]